MTDLHAAMRAVLASANLPAQEAGPLPSNPVVTISRDHGALGRQTADVLGRRLKTPVYDWNIFNDIAKRLDVDPDTVKMLDESVAKMRDMWLLRLFTGRNLSADVYRKHLVNVLLGLSHVGGIILGRGANVVLSASKALRVRIVGSLDVCARRVAERDKTSFADAKEECVRINENRARFLWDLFAKQPSDPETLDLLINTDRLDDPEDAAETILAAYKGMSRLYGARKEE